MGKLIDDFILRQYKRVVAKQSKGKLQAQFKDDMGRWWSTFRDQSDIPVSRTAQQMTFLQFMAAGLTPKQMEDALEAVDLSLSEGKLVMAGAILQSLRELPKKVVNIHALINVIAASYVREDEDEHAFVESIHQEKCNYLLGEIERGTFFFERPTLINAIVGFGISTDQLTNNFYASKAVARNLSLLLDSARLQIRPKESAKTD